MSAIKQNSRDIYEGLEKTILCSFALTPFVYHNDTMVNILGAIGICSFIAIIILLVKYMDAKSYFSILTARHYYENFLLWMIIGTIFYFEDWKPTSYIGFALAVISLILFLTKSIRSNRQ